VKSPIANGRCSVLSDSGERVDNGREVRSLRCDWIHFLARRCSALGRAAMGLSVS